MEQTPERGQGCSGKASDSTDSLIGLDSSSNDYDLLNLQPTFDLSSFVSSSDESGYSRKSCLTEVKIRTNPITNCQITAIAVYDQMNPEGRRKLNRGKVRSVLLTKPLQEASH